MTALSNTQELIERSLFERIRKELVDKAYLPNIVSYDDNAAGWAQYGVDLNTIVSTRDFAIEVFSTGTNEAKGDKKVPRIVLESGSFLPGNLGGDPKPYFEDQGSNYKGLVTPPQTADYYIDICLISNSIVQNRILNSILALAIPRRGYIPWYTNEDENETKSFFARYLNYYKKNDTKSGIIEHVYSYEIPDAWESEDIEKLSSVAKISEITLNPNIQKYMDGSWGHDSDSLIIT